MRFYGFSPEEIVTGPDGMLDLEIDPKLAWALAHREEFPVDLNRAPKEVLLRVPGIGKKTVEKLLRLRRHRAITLQDLARLRVPLTKLRPFVVLPDHRPRGLDSLDLRQRMASPKQLSLL